LCFLFFFVISFIALGLVWNLALLKRLAAITQELKASQAAAQSSLKDRENLLKIERESVFQSQTRLQNFQEKANTLKTSLSVLGGSVANLDAIENKMQTMINQEKAITASQETLSIELRAFLEKQENDRKSRLYDDLIVRLRDEFDHVDQNRSGTIDTPQEKQQLVTLLARHGIEWNDGWAQQTGPVTKSDLIDGIEKDKDKIVSSFLNKKKAKA